VRRGPDRRDGSHQLFPSVTTRRASARARRRFAGAQAPINRGSAFSPAGWRHAQRDRYTRATHDAGHETQEQWQVSRGLTHHWIASPLGKAPRRARDGRSRSCASKLLRAVPDSALCGARAQFARIPRRPTARVASASSGPVRSSRAASWSRRDSQNGRSLAVSDAWIVASRGNAAPMGKRCPRAPNPDRRDEPTLQNRISFSAGAGALAPPQRVLPSCLQCESFLFYKQEVGGGEYMKIKINVRAGALAGGGKSRA
jgi:hypothetical protein